MSSTRSLPNPIAGNWIWKPEDHCAHNSYVFLRGEFVLDEIPTSAELWIASPARYTVFVNGRTICHGRYESAPFEMKVRVIETAFCLEHGRNTVCVALHYEKIKPLSQFSKNGMLWVQLVVDGETKLVSDENWLSWDANRCYGTNTPRIGAWDGYIETTDLTVYPEGWQEIDFSPDASWKNAQVIASVDQSPWRLQVVPDLDVSSEHYSYLNIIGYGHAEKNLASAPLEFRNSQHLPGVYWAETFLHLNSSEDVDGLLAQVIGDCAFKLYINHQLVLQRQESLDCASQAERTEASVLLSGIVNLKKGPNRIRILADVRPYEAPITLLFPEIESGAIRFLRGKEAISMPGWTVYGPLNIPFAKSEEHLEFAGRSRQTFFSEHISDPAGELLASTFTIEEFGEEGIPLESVEMTSGQFMVIELEKYLRGTPELTITGSEGDIIDIVYGDCLDENLVRPVKGGTRKVFSIRCGEGTFQWQGVAHHGMRYLLIYCRRAHAQVSISEVGLRYQQIHYREPASFSCSDELLNQVWEISQTTLEATFDGMFRMAAGHHEYQFLPHAMPAALSSLFLLGKPDFSECALRDFAQFQHEDGACVTMIPGGGQDYLDSMLIWPVWLARHHQYAGNKDFLQQMIPHLNALLLYFEKLGGDKAYLGDPESDEVLPFFIDHDPIIKRQGMSTALNAMYCYALLKAGWIYEQIGEKEKLRYCGHRAAEIAKAVRDLTWDENRGLFCEGVANGQPIRAYSLQTNVLALASGIASEEHYDSIFNNLFIEYAPFHNLEVTPETDSPYFKFFLLDMAYALGHREWATDFLRYYWGTMVQRGATTWWEFFSPELEELPRESQCHACGIGVNYFIISEILGVRPVEPGFYQFYFDPHLTAIEWATASIPTPHGLIKLDWRFLETGQLEVTLDATYPVEVVPQLDKAVASDTVLKVGDNVSILK
ncbi:MAG: hypothetical protein D6820_13330 [Lentisphaerae bacterium]|nr:MAG: hypothetical protein D6820_13330 [Lentisphaerota bacterium]